MKRLILASSSKYKRGLLARLDIPFETLDAGIDEAAHPSETPVSLAVRLARAKAEAVARKLCESRVAASPSNIPPQSPGAEVVIGADQVAALGDTALRKPGTHAEALRQLVSCQGRTVVFHTAAAILDTGENLRLETLVSTQVDFAELDIPRLDRYLRLEQPYDCAGGFKAEALGVVLFDAIRSDDPTALIGLPLIWLARSLRTLGLDPLA